MSIYDLFAGLSAKYVREPNGSKNRSFTKKGPGRIHQQDKPKKDAQG